MQDVMFWVLLLSGFLTFSIYMGCQVATKMWWSHLAPCSCSTVLGPILRPKDEGKLGVLAHEWTHVLTLAPIILPASMSFSWLLWFEYGWLAAILLAIPTNWAIRITMETLADIGGMLWVGPRKFMDEVVETMVTLPVMGGAMATVVSYPPWRLICLRRAKARLLRKKRAEKGATT